jgi:hypothetical protein
MVKAGLTGFRTITGIGLVFLARSPPVRDGHAVNRVCRYS